MKKKLTIITVVYIVFLCSIVVYKVAKKDNAYYNYKKLVAESAEKVKASSKDTKETSSNTNKENGLNNTGSTTTGNNTTGNNVSGTNTSGNSNMGTSTNVNNTVETYSNVKFTRHLGSGATGDDVKKLQYILKEKGFYKGEITGNLDKDTAKALVDYQKSKNIKPADGILGPGTWGTF